MSGNFVVCQLQPFGICGSAGVGEQVTATLAAGAFENAMRVSPCP